MTITSVTISEHWAEEFAKYWQEPWWMYEWMSNAYERERLLLKKNHYRTILDNEEAGTSLYEYEL